MRNLFKLFVLFAFLTIVFGAKNVKKDKKANKKHVKTKKVDVRYILLI